MTTEKKLDNFNRKTSQDVKICFMKKPLIEVIVCYEKRYTSYKFNHNENLLAEKNDLFAEKKFFLQQKIGKKAKTNYCLTIVKKSEYRRIYK